MATLYFTICRKLGKFEVCESGLGNTFQYNLKNYMVIKWSVSGEFVRWSHFTVTDQLTCSYNDVSLSQYWQLFPMTPHIKFLVTRGQPLHTFVSVFRWQCKLMMAFYQDLEFWSRVWFKGLRPILGGLLSQCTRARAKQEVLFGQAWVHWDNKPRQSDLDHDYNMTISIPPHEY